MIGRLYIKALRYDTTENMVGDIPHSFIEYSEFNSKRDPLIFSRKIETTGVYVMNFIIMLVNSLIILSQVCLCQFYWHHMSLYIHDKGSLGVCYVSKA